MHFRAISGLMDKPRGTETQHHIAAAQSGKAGKSLQQSSTNQWLQPKGTGNPVKVPAPPLSTVQFIAAFRISTVNHDQQRPHTEAQPWHGWRRAVRSRMKSESGPARQMVLVSTVSKASPVREERLVLSQWRCHYWGRCCKRSCGLSLLISPG